MILGGVAGSAAYSEGVSDWGRYLPMSNRRRGDEREVTANRARETAVVLRALAGLVEAEAAARPEPLARPLTAGTIEDALRALLTRLRLSAGQRLAVALGALDVPSAEVVAIEADRLAAALHAEAERFDAAGARASVATLGEAVVTALEVAEGIRRPLAIEPTTLGAVALDRALRAPLERRSVARARTLVASDGDWRLGTGPELRAPGAAIVLFLAGRGALPVHEPAPPPVDDRPSAD